jgi:hypothetical protein
VYSCLVLREVAPEPCTERESHIRRRPLRQGTPRGNPRTSSRSWAGVGYGASEFPWPFRTGIHLSARSSILLVLNHLVRGSRSPGEGAAASPEGTRNKASCDDTQEETVGRWVGARGGQSRGPAFGMADLPGVFIPHIVESFTDYLCLPEVEDLAPASLARVPQAGSDSDRFLFKRSVPAVRLGRRSRGRSRRWRAE